MRTYKLSMASKPESKVKSKSEPKSEQEAAAVIQKFNLLRTEQRNIATKIAELNGDKNEHQLVIDALKKVDPDRKCFRMVGGVLAERTAKEVIPSLQYNIDQLNVLTKKLNDQLEEKGKDINLFREKHNIKIRGEQGLKKPSEEDSTDSGTSQGILVS